MAKDESGRPDIYSAPVSRSETRFPWETPAPKSDIPQSDDSSQYGYRRPDRDESIRGDLERAYDQHSPHSVTPTSAQQDDVRSPLRHADPAKPMHQRDRVLYVILAWTPIPAALIVGCIIAWASNQLSGLWASIGVAAGIVVMTIATIHALEKKPPLPRSPSPIIFIVAAITWLLIGWQTWLAFQKPTTTVIGFNQAQVDEKIANAVANLNSQLMEANRQRDAAQRETNAIRQQVQNTPMPPRNLDTPRVYAEKTVATLWEPCEGRTQLQCDVLIGDEKGKWINASGRVGLIQPNGMVTLTVGNQPVICFFEEYWKTKLGTFRNGETMNVVGKVQAYNGATLLLGQCELHG